MEHVSASADALTQAIEVPGGFAPVRQAGSGTFCDVWQVRDRTTGELFALKRLRNQWQTDPRGKRLLENEAKAGRGVRSPYVVRFVDYVDDGVRPWLLLEWLEGETLEHLLDREGALAAPKAVWIARQCAQGLMDLTCAGFSHGDLKPANVFITSTGAAKLIDLGLARELNSSHEPRVLSGTPEYLAPELLAGDQSNPAARDLYSLGVILYQMLTGHSPFEAESTADVLRRQRELRPVSVRRYSPQIPRELAAFVDHLLAKQPLRRHTVHEVVRTLIGFELTNVREAARAA